MLSTNRERPIVADLPARFAAAQLDDLDANLRARLAETPERWHVFSGGTGRGKSHAMAALFRDDWAEAARQFYASPAWIEWAEFLADVKAHWDLKTSDADAFDPLRWACTFRGMLCLDDVGAEIGDFGAERFARIVQARYSSSLPLTVTTNLRAAQVGERYGDRSLSRITECAEWIVMDGPDRRLAAHARRRDRTRQRAENDDLFAERT